MAAAMITAGRPSWPARPAEENHRDTWTFIAAVAFGAWTAVLFF